MPLGLTGAGDRAHLLGPDVDLETHVDDIANVLYYEDLDGVVLVGHSYGGVVATGAADRHPDRVAKLVYLDAPLGRSHTEIFPAAADPSQFPRQVLDGTEVIVVPSEDLVAFYGITDQDEAAWTLARMTPHPWKASAATLALANPHALQSTPRYHIVASQTVELGAHDALPASERAPGRYFEVEGPHALMSVRAHEVTGLLQTIAASHPAAATSDPQRHAE